MEFHFEYGRLGLFSNHNFFHKNILVVFYIDAESVTINKSVVNVIDKWEIFKVS